MATCSNCGASFEGTQASCPFCGFQLGSQQQQQGFGAPAASAPRYQPPIEQPRTGAPVAPGQPPYAAPGGQPGAGPYAPFGAGGPPGPGTGPAPMGGVGAPGAFGTPPAMGMGGGDGGPVPNTGLAMGLSIFCTLCCCLPGGIAGLVFTNQAKNAMNLGDWEVARNKLKTAYIIIGISIGLGAIINIIAFFAQMSQSGGYGGY